MSDFCYEYDTTYACYFISLGHITAIILNTLLNFFQFGVIIKMQKKNHGLTQDTDQKVMNGRESQTSSDEVFG